MKYKRGQSGNPNGRPKGVRNKFTSLKDEFLKAFHDEDGIDGAKGMKKLIKDSTRNKFIFLQMISKMLPSNVTVDGDLNVTFQSSEKFLPKKDDKKK